MHRTPRTSRSELTNQETQFIAAHQMALYGLKPAHWLSRDERRLRPVGRINEVIQTIRVMNRVDTYMDEVPPTTIPAKYVAALSKNSGQLTRADSRAGERTGRPPSIGMYPLIRT